jgi:hypothetical protein
MPPTQNEGRQEMDQKECRNERLSSKTVGIVFIVVSLLLMGVGLVVLPVIGFIFAVPFLILGIGMLAAPQSKTCQLIMNGLRSKQN